MQTHVLIAAALCIASTTVLAASPAIVIDPPYNAATDEIPGFIASPPGVDFLKNAIRNPDGSLTIRAGQQVPEANEFNRAYCESMGGRDITNESDMTFHGLYAGACEGGTGNEARPVPGTGTGRIFVPIPKAQPQSSEALPRGGPLTIIAARSKKNKQLLDALAQAAK